jgi:hypothetical protein
VGDIGLSPIEAHRAVDWALTERLRGKFLVGDRGQLLLAQ